MSGCAITGPADDGYDNSNEWVDNGRLLSDETKVVYKSKQHSGKTITSAETGADSSSEMDFTAYQQWQKAREDNSMEYQKFLQWQEFEAFQRWKEQQSN